MEKPRKRVAVDRAPANATTFLKNGSILEDSAARTWNDCAAAQVQRSTLEVAAA